MSQVTAKRCTGCKVVKPLEAFYWNKQRDGSKARHSKCQVCRRGQFATWARTPRGRELKRLGILRRVYGLDAEAFAALFARQGGKCAICKEPEKRLHRRGTQLRLSVDHDHATGKVRGLLCNSCNAGLGAFEDQPERLQAAAAYLRKRRL
jgi:hypothetical protein